MGVSGDRQMRFGRRAVFFLLLVGAIVATGETVDCDATSTAVEMVCHAFGDRSDPCEASRHQHHASCDTSLPANAQVAGDGSTIDLANVATAKKAASADNKDGPGNDLTGELGEDDEGGRGAGSPVDKAKAATAEAKARPPVGTSKAARMKAATVAKQMSPAEYSQ